MDYISLYDTININICPPPGCNPGAYLSFVMPRLVSATTIPGTGRRLLLSSVATVAMLVAACGGSAGSTGGGSSSSGASTAIQVTTAQTPLGTVLVGPNGHTLYSLVNAQNSPLPCTGGCLSSWPPLLGSSAQAGSGVSAALSVGSNQQVTVTAGMLPLYYFAGDTSGGTTNGEGLQLEGGTWYAIGPGGNPVKQAGAGSPTSPGNGY